MQCKTGLKRCSLDKFYTKTHIANICIESLKKNLNILEDELIIEPSAGSGAFTDELIQVYPNVLSYDIEPSKKCTSDIIQQDYLLLDTDELSSQYDKIHVVGNPPFGRQSSLAKKFIKKSCLFAESISFILPKSFRKDSYKKCFDNYFHLILEIDLPKDSFTIEDVSYNVPCIFQIWVKKDVKRKVEPVPTEEGFNFVSKPNIKIKEGGYKENVFKNDIPDFGILRAGGGKTCGRISKDYTDGIKCYPEAWLFIKLDSKYDKNKFYEEYKKIDWNDDSNVGARSISKPTFIKGINKLLKSLD